MISPAMPGGALSRGAPTSNAESCMSRTRTEDRRLSKVPAISIIDDDESVRVTTAKFVRLHGFVAYTFASAEEFLQSPQVNHTSCLITDVRMPGMSGIDLQDHLIAQGHRMPIIFITAFPAESRQARALQAGAVCVLSKPFDGQTLIDRLNETLARYDDRTVDE
jgi:FixJ family two-component response regulator